MTEAPKYCRYDWYAQLLARRPGEQKCDWEKRQSCGPGRHLEECLEKTCACGTVFMRRKREPRSKFAKRKSCSVACANIERANVVPDRVHLTEKQMEPIQTADWPEGVRFTDDPREAARLPLFTKLSPPDTTLYSLAGCTAFFAMDHRHAGL